MIKSNSSSFTSNNSRIGKAISDNSLIGVPSCFSGGRRIVKWTRSTDGSDLRMLRQTLSPACGSPDTSKTRRRSRTPLMTTTAWLLTRDSTIDRHDHLMRDIAILAPCQLGLTRTRFLFCGRALGQILDPDHQLQLLADQAKTWRLIDNQPPVPLVRPPGQ